MTKDLKQKSGIVNDHNNGNYNQGDDVHSIVKFNTEIVKPFLCDYSDAYILVTSDIKVAVTDNNTRVAIKNFHPFTRISFKLNGEQVDTADNLDLTMESYNMLEYSDNYADTTASLYQYKRPEPRDNNGVLNDLTAANSSSFKCQSGLIQKQLTKENGHSETANVSADPNFNVAHRLWRNIKIVVALKYVSNFFRSLEFPLINTKLYMELNWTQNSVLSSINQNSIFQITRGELYIPVVTLNIEDNNKLSELLSEEFEKTVTWNEYKSKIEGINISANNNNFKRTTLDVLIDGRNFYDQNVNSNIVRYNEHLKMTTGRSEDYSTGCFMDYYYYIKDFNFVGIDLSHQSVLDTDSKVNQQIEFVYKLPSGDNAIDYDLLTVLEKEKQTVLKFSQGTVKVY